MTKSYPSPILDSVNAFVREHEMQWAGFQPGQPLTFPIVLERNFVTAANLEEVDKAAHNTFEPLGLRVITSRDSTILDPDLSRAMWTLTINLEWKL